MKCYGLDKVNTESKAFCIRNFRYCWIFTFERVQMTEISYAKKKKKIKKSGFHRLINFF